MEMLVNILAIMGEYIPMLLAISIVVVFVGISHWFLIARHKELGAENKLPRQLVMLGLTVFGVVVVLMTIPMSETTRGQVLGLLGIVLTAVIALSSTTFVANAMAGLMLRIIKTFKPGDFVRIGEQFGRVTERGLFHTEIQTEDRDLMTFPNLYMVTSPVTVVMKSGTIISAQVSLGYDVSRSQIEEYLCEAAESIGLQEPFVQVVELGDFSVIYRVAGFLAEVKQLLTVRSNLRKSIMDVLHNNNIEIVSPNFMNQRQLEKEKVFIPAMQHRAAKIMQTADEEAPESLIFDKGTKVAEMEQLKVEQEKLKKQMHELSSGAIAYKDQKKMIEAKIEGLAKQIKAIKEEIEQHAVE